MTAETTNHTTQRRLGQTLLSTNSISSSTHNDPSAGLATLVTTTTTPTTSAVVNNNNNRQQQYTTIAAPGTTTTTTTTASSTNNHSKFNNGHSPRSMLEKVLPSSTRSLTNNTNKEVISACTSPSSATAGSGTQQPSIFYSSRSLTTTRTQQQSQQHSQQAMSPAIISAPLQGQSSQSNLMAPSPQQQPPLRERRDSHSVASSDAAGWQWQENNDPDDQEQALFEQRLCDDIYGVAVRKINQNGKSSLRYVKCTTIDGAELDEYYFTGAGGGIGGGGSHHLTLSSNRSVSSRSWASRNGFSRLMGNAGGTGSSNNSHAGGNDDHEHRNLIPGKKIRVLTWGKKKDVKIPLERFVAVRKGKTTERAKRNPCPASRILSLITSDDHHEAGYPPSSSSNPTTTLDIEAPTRLDRDKFARAFSRFLNIPLIDGDQPFMPQPPGMDMRSVRSDMTPPPSLRMQATSQPMSAGGYNMHDSTANSSVPDIAMTTTNSYTTNGSRSRNAPMPVVHTTPGNNFADTAAASAGLPPSRPSSRIFKRKNNVGGSAGGSLSERNIFSSQSRSNPNSFDKSDQQGSSMQSSSIQQHNNHRNAVNGVNNNNNNNNIDGNASFGNARHSMQQQSTPAKEATLEIPVSKPSTATPATSTIADLPPGTEDAGSIVSSITGGGFDQDLVEELHLALEKMKAELEESRAEAARAVKVAEQAIQSAENSNSKDWNSTVTHKAAEAAAAAQKKSAEAMARARLAEERLEAEKKNALMWKKQLESAEEQAGHWQTRAAAAEVQRYAVAESLESERKKNAHLLAASEIAPRSKSNGKSSTDPFDPFGNSFSESSMHDTDKAEVDRLRSKLAMESARRRKLLDELQDLRGSVRVYCRPRSSTTKNLLSEKSTITMASSEVLMLDRSSGSAAESTRNASPTSTSPLSFEFDGILSTDQDQHDVYAEFEAVCASVVEGYKICVMTYGQANAGKTYTMLGEVEHGNDHTVCISDHGVHLRAMKQLFSIVEHRRDMYYDVVTMNLIEVHDERILDMLAGTDYGETRGKVEGSKRMSGRKSDNPSDDGTGTTASFQGNSITSNKPKLEIKTNRDGETVVYGVVSVEVSSFDDIYRVWTESLAARSRRLAEQDLDARSYELGSHIIASLKISSRNITTGIVTSGKMQFVDFASSDVVSKRSSDGSWKFANKSLNAMNEVVRARSQYQRSVPYRNSTITHILSDSLEADTKVVLVACVSPEEKDLQNTTATLRFAQEMRKVVIGKATRHLSTSASATSPF
jgi:kinesin family protein C2/C3